MNEKSPVLSAGPLKLRKPETFDLPPLYALADDYKHKAMDDYDVFNAEVVKEILQGHTLVIDEYGYAVGAIWFDDVIDDLRGTVHLMVRPRYMPKVLEQELIPQAFDWAFKNLKIGKILAYPMHTQKTALKLLRKYRFYEHKPWHKHTKVKGTKVDVIMFELRKSFWEKNR